MAGPRDYSTGTITALALLSKGTCYWPDPPCPVPATVAVKGQVIFNLQIAHIRAASPKGPRFDAGMTNDQRRSFANLIFLCTPHHQLVDKLKPGDYPAEMLEGWKAARETGRLAELKQQAGLTDDRLEEVIAEALEERLREMRDAIDRVERIDSESAVLLRDLAERLDAPSLSSETAEMLYSAASMLVPILEESNVNSLYAAAQSLQEMQETLQQLPYTVEELRRSMPDC